VLVPKLTVALESGELTIWYSAAAFPAVLVTRIEEPGNVKPAPAVSVVAALLPSSPIMMAFELVVDTPVTDGEVPVPVALYGRPPFESKGLLVFAPDIPNATAEIPFVESPLLNVTVIEIEPPALNTAHHSEMR